MKMSDYDLRFALGKGLADLAERVVRHIDDVRDHRHHEDEDRETVVELASLDGSPRAHYVPSDVWEQREHAEGVDIYEEVYGGVYVVREMRFEEGVPIVWGVWPDVLADDLDSRTSAGDEDGQ